MGDFPHYFDIILFAMVAAFLVLRLRSVLGRRTGNERPPRPVVPPAEAPASRRQGRPAAARQSARRRRRRAPPRRRCGRRRARAHPQRRSRVSTRRISAGRAGRLRDDRRGFAAGDKTQLRPLLSDDVYKPFAAAIDERDAAGETLETRICSSKRPTSSRPGSPAARRGSRSSSSPTRSMCCAPMTAASSTATPTVRSKRPISGAFARDTRSTDPNWVLVATASG